MCAAQAFIKINNLIIQVAQCSSAQHRTIRKGKREREIEQRDTQILILIADLLNMHSNFNGEQHSILL